MSASKRAAEKIDHAYCVGEMDERPRERAEIAAIIDAEYVPLINAVRDLMEAAEKYGIETDLGHLDSDLTESVAEATRKAIPSISAMVAREEAVRRLIVDLRHDAELLPYAVGQRLRQAADAFEQIFPKAAAIVEGK